MVSSELCNKKNCFHLPGDSIQTFFSLFHTLTHVTYMPGCRSEDEATHANPRPTTASTVTGTNIVSAR